MPSFPAEKVAYWYFRLNGCFTIPNFIVHPDTGGDSARTEADLLAVRFPYRREGPLDRQYGRGDNSFEDCSEVLSELPLLIIAEVTLGPLKLNGPWTDPDRRNLHRVLRAIGMHPPDEVEAVASALYERRHYEGSSSEVRLFGIGNSGEDQFKQEHAGAVPILWDDALRFIHARFVQHRRQKSDHQYWDHWGRMLYKLAANNRDVEAFVRQVDLGS